MEKKIDSSLGVFFRTPEYGKVKTRLASWIGHEKTLAIYNEMLKVTFKKALRIFSIADLYGFYDGPEPTGYNIREIELLPQKGNDLGEKICNALNILFQKGYKKVILIGSDSPDLPTVYIKEAFERLNIFRLVIGPSEDGGYYLIGMTEPLEFLFKDIPWSTSSVLMKTLDLATRHGIEYSLLPEWYDVDDLEGLRKWKGVADFGASIFNVTIQASKT